MILFLVITYTEAKPESRSFLIGWLCNKRFLRFPDNWLRMQDFLVWANWNLNVFSYFKDTLIISCTALLFANSIIGPKTLPIAVSDRLISLTVTMVMNGSLLCHSNKWGELDRQIWGNRCSKHVTWILDANIATLVYAPWFSRRSCCRDVMLSRIDTRLELAVHIVRSSDCLPGHGLITLIHFSITTRLEWRRTLRKSIHVHALINITYVNPVHPRDAK